MVNIVYSQFFGPVPWFAVVKEKKSVLKTGLRTVVIVKARSDHLKCGMWWLRGRFGALHLESHRLSGRFSALHLESHRFKSH